jgi:DNA-binding ferritin-like protein
MKDYKQFEKDSSAADSSADSVDEYLQTLGNEDARELRYYSQEQPFSAEEMTQLVNEERLNELLAQSDAFLSSLNSEIGDFDE